MSILQALQDFLEGYEGMELRPLGEILTDLTRAAPPSYSLAPAGGGTDTQDVVGNRLLRRWRWVRSSQRYRWVWP